MYANDGGVHGLKERHALDEKVPTSARRAVEVESTKAQGLWYAERNNMRWAAGLTYRKRENN
jgi:hypothetical protein